MVELKGKPVKIRRGPATVKGRLSASRHREEAPGRRREDDELEPGNLLAQSSPWDPTMDGRL